MQNDAYGHDFYENRYQNTVHSARTILSITLDALPEVNSAIDIGCGVGAWLSVLKEKGVREIQGLDGPWVNLDQLAIPQENFRQTDLEGKINIDRKYDLAITLEVAEHLSEECAGRFVESLTSASDFVLFSAAIPFQGGVGHINEQWPDYWANLFAERGFIALDFIRSQIWNNNEIPVWYRQNILLFAKKEKVDQINSPKLGEFNNNLPMSLVHPDKYLLIVKDRLTVAGSWKLFRRAVKSWAKKKLRTKA